MTKAEYMKKLQERLENFGRELQEDILEDYRQHFAEGELQGKSDEEIIEELGNIEDMIRDLPEADLKEDVRRRMPDVEAMQGIGASGKGAEERASAAGQESAWRNAGESRKQGDSGAGTDRFFDYSGKYDAMILSGDTANIYLEPSEDDEIHVECRNIEGKYEYYQYEENDIFYAGIRCGGGTGGCWTGIEGNGKSFTVKLFGHTIVSYGRMDGFDDSSPALSVKVPKGMPRLSAEASSGNIYVQGLTQNELQLESSSGDIKVKNVAADSVKACASSGDMEVRDTGCSGLFHLETSSGDINMYGIKAGRAEVGASSGDIRIENIKCDAISLESSSGDVSTSGVDAGSFRIETSSGDVGVDGASCRTAEVEVSSGDVNIEHMKFETGSVSADAGDLTVSNSRFMTGQFVSNQGDISLTGLEFETGTFMTDSGDISGKNTKGTKGSFTVAGGDINLQDEGEECCREYRCMSDMGDISVQSRAAVYECSADSGDISIIAEGAPKKLSVCLSNGDASVRAKGTPENVNIQSDNGDIVLKLPDTEGMTATVDVGWGDGVVKWDGSRQEVKKGTFTYGSGASKVNVRTGNGDIAVSGIL